MAKEFVNFWLFRCKKHSSRLSASSSTGKTCRFEKGTKINKTLFHKRPSRNIHSDYASSRSMATNISSNHNKSTSKNNAENKELRGNSFSTIIDDSVIHCGTYNRFVSSFSSCFFFSSSFSFSTLQCKKKCYIM